MVKHITYFEDSSGKGHKTQYEAWSAELVLWLSNTKTINEAQAKSLVEHITAGGGKRAGELADIIGELGDCMPAIAATFEDAA